MRAIWHGALIAESDECVEVGGYFYFPRASVHLDLLRLTAKTASDKDCPHGVQFYDVVDVVKNLRSERAAWSYEAPQAGMKNVDHWIGFWGDVAIEA